MTGHLLLIQSLHRAFQGIADRVLPLVDSEALRQWACCAMDSLKERDPEALKRKLLPLLKACDKLILGRLAPASERADAPKAHRTEEERGLGSHEPAAEGDDALEAHRTEEEPLPVEADREAAVHQVARGSHPREPGGVSAEGDVPGADFTNLSDCPTASCASRPEEGPQSEPSPTGSWSEYPPTFLLLGCAPPLLTPQDNPPLEHLQPFTPVPQTRACTPHPKEVAPRPPR